MAGLSKPATVLYYKPRAWHLHHAMHNISIGTHKFQGPSGWEELDARALLLVGSFGSLINSSERVKENLLRLLFKIPLKEFYSLKKSQIKQLYPLLHWFNQKNSLQKWLLPAFKVNGHTWCGPVDKLANITAEQFMYAEAAYERFLNSKGEAGLPELFCSLYTRKRFGFYKQAFSPAVFQKNVLIASALKMHVKKAVSLNYAGCRNFIISKHPHIWKEIDDHEPTATDVTNQRVSWASFFLDLAGDKFGTYEQTIKTSVWLVLADLDKKSKTNMELEALNKR